MVEIMVAIGIIAILLAIAVPAMMGMVRANRVKATEGTLKTLETAIEMFARDEPLAGGAEIDCLTVSSSSLTLFGPFPPTPSARLSVREADPLECRMPTEPGDTATNGKFGQILEGFFDPEDNNEEFNFGAFRPGDHASIESLVFFLQRYSPEARDAIARIPENLKTNKDAGSDQLVISDHPEILIEIVDAWGKPLAYHVEAGFQKKSDLTITGLRHRWELRSAGEDDEFDPQFSDLPDSDDVVIQSEWTEK